jgi:hypothetical protein
MDDLLGEEACRSRFGLDQQRERRTGQRVELAAQLGHRGARPQKMPFLPGVVNGQRARDLGARLGLSTTSFSHR